MLDPGLGMHPRRARAGAPRAVRLALMIVLSVAMAAALGGCRIRGRRVDKEPPPREFISPLNPVGIPGMTMEEIRRVLQDRRGSIRSAQAALTLTVGTRRMRGRHQFDGSLYWRPATGESPELLRVRGTADAGPVFDFLLSRNEVQILVHPERKYYRGSVADLRNNSQVLYGAVQPDDVAGALFVERRLLQQIRENRGTEIREAPDHFLLTFPSRGDAEEQASLRTADLLVDKVERRLRGEVVSTIQYSGYRQDETGGLIPIRFDAATPDGTELTVEVGDIRFNAPAPENIETLTVPQGFDRLQL